MALFNSFVRACYAGRLRQFDLMASKPEAMQDGQLRNLIDTAKNTAFGTAHHFDCIGGYSDFARSVPITDYEGFSPYVERMIGGETDVCWPGKIRWFAKSSGTTAKSKFIPVTTDALRKCHYQGGIDVVATYFRQNPDTKIYLGRCLTLGGSKKISSLNAGCQMGDLSAIMIGNAPLWSRMFKTPSNDVALLSEWEEKLEMIAQATVRQNVTSLAGVPSWFLILLKYIMDKEGKDNIQDVWPRLELFIHGGINFEPYRAQYNAIAPRGINFLETYNASEGFFALQTDAADRGLQLMLDYGVFYEFVPLDEVGMPHPPNATPLAGVEKDKDYAIVISSNAGLWRYMMGDTVRFTSLNPHKLIISGRTKLFINAFGEELMIGNAETALAKVCARTGAVVRDYTAAPVFMEAHTRGCHQWLIEFDTPPDDAELFADMLDKALQELNSDYEAKRYKDITLARLKMTVARKGLFFEWLKRHGRVGGQNKVPRLRNDRSVIDDMLRLN